MNVAGQFPPYRPAEDDDSGSVSMIQIRDFLGRQWRLMALVTGLAIVVGANAPALEAPLRPENGKWLDAFGRASDETLRARPDDVVRGVLQALRAPGGLSSPSPGTP